MADMSSNDNSVPVILTDCLINDYVICINLFLNASFSKNLGFLRRINTEYFKRNNINLEVQIKSLFSINLPKNLHLFMKSIVQD